MHQKNVYPTVQWLATDAGGKMEVVVKLAIAENIVSLFALGFAAELGAGIPWRMLSYVELGYDSWFGVLPPSP